MTRKSSIMVIWLGAALLLCGCASHPHSPRPPRLVGSIRGSTYFSPEGGFSMPVPVSAEVGGRVLRDGRQSVTFGDNWGSRITVSGEAISEHSGMMTMLESAGREKALTEFARRQYGDLITVHYHPEACEGLTTFIYLRPASPKTACAIFLHDRRLYIIQTDMLPGVALLAQSDEKSQLERELWLEGTAMTLAQSIESR